METPAREMPPSRSAVMDTLARRNAMSQKMVNLPVMWASLVRKIPEANKREHSNEKSRRVRKFVLSRKQH